MYKAWYMPASTFHYSAVCTPSPQTKRLDKPFINQWGKEMEENRKKNKFCQNLALTMPMCPCLVCVFFLAEQHVGGMMLPTGRNATTKWRILFTSYKSYPTPLYHYQEISQGNSNIIMYQINTTCQSHSAKTLIFVFLCLLTTNFSKLIGVDWSPG